MELIIMYSLLDTILTLCPAGNVQILFLINWAVTTFWSDSQFLPYFSLVHIPNVEALANSGNVSNASHYTFCLEDS